MTDRASRRRRWWVAAATALGVGVTAALGVWQLNRANTKLALQASVDARSALPTLEARAALTLSSDEARDHWHRRVVLRGSWVPEHTVHLDNRPMARRQGFYVLTPLREVSTQRLVWVQRGWAPRNFNDRTALPPVQTPTGLVEVEGRMAPPPSRVYEPGPPSGGAIRQNLDLAAWAQQTGLAVAPWVLLQTSSAPGAPPDGLQRDWPVPDSGVHKHWGYAAQWFSLSALMAGLFVWFQLIAPRRREPSH